MTTTRQHSFFEGVYEIVGLIPYGRVSTYGAIACCLGAVRSARMVGWALHQAVYRKGIPAHRVVNRNGLLTGKYHFENLHTMEQLLISEGVFIQNNQVQNFKNIFWDPMQINELLS